MKKKSFIAILATVSLVVLSLSCQKNTRFTEEEKALKLEAPSGLRIAATIQELKTEASAVVSNKYGKEHDFSIMYIEYLPVTKGYAAIISYRLQDGTISNYARISGVPYKVSPAATTVTTQKRKEGEGSIQQQAAHHHVTISCQQGSHCQCHLSVIINTDTGELTIDCGCNTCEVSIGMEDL